MILRWSREPFHPPTPVYHKEPPDSAASARAVSALPARFSNPGNVWQPPLLDPSDGFLGCGIPPPIGLTW